MIDNVFFAFEVRGVAVRKYLICLAYKYYTYLKESDSN